MTDHLTGDNPELDRAWGYLRDLAGDYSDRCPETGECWQYMGTVQQPGGQTVHQFRHRSRPQDARRISLLARGPIEGSRVYLDIAASRDYAPTNTQPGGTLMHGKATPNTATVAG